jgi:hypothetical protein
MTKHDEMSLDPLWYILFFRATLKAVLQKIVEELKLEKSFKTLVKVSELEIQKQNEEAALISMEEGNVKEINKLHNILEGDLKQGMDKLNKQRDTIAWLKVRIINAVFLQLPYFSIDNAHPNIFVAPFDVWIMHICHIA